MRGRSVIVLAALGALLVVLASYKRVTLLYAPLSYYDEGVLLTDSHLVHRGQVTFRDFYSIYAPGIYYLIGGVWSLFGETALVTRWLGLVVALTLAFAAGRHAGVMGGRRFSLLTSGLLLAWLIPLGNVPYAWFAALVLVFVAVELLTNDDPRRIWLGGVVLGVSSAFRHDLFTYVGGLWGALVLGGFWLRRRRHELSTLPLQTLLGALVLALGLALPIWLVIVLSGGAWNVWRDLVYNVSHYIMQSRTLPFPDLLAVRAVPGLGLSVPLVLVRYFEAGVVACFLAPFMGLWLVVWSKGTPRVALRVALLAAIAIAAVPQMSARTDGDHVLLALTPALTLLGGTVEHLLARRGRTAWAGAALLVALLLPIPHAFACVPRTRDTLVLGVPREGGVPQPEPEVVRARRQVLELVNRVTRPGDPIFVGTLTHTRAHTVEMDLYFLFERTGATRFMQFDPNLTTREDVQQEMIADFRRRGARLAILSARPVLEPQKNLLPGSSLLDRYLAENFREAASFPPYRVLVRRDVAF